MNCEFKYSELITHNLGASLLSREYRTNPFFDPFGVDVHPIVGPVDRFGIPFEASEILIREHPRSIANVPRLEDEAVVKHKRKKLIQCDFLCADLAPRIAQTL